MSTEALRQIDPEDLLRALDSHYARRFRQFEGSRNPRDIACHNGILEVVDAVKFLVDPNHKPQMITPVEQDMLIRDARSTPEEIQ